jgi:two-component system chemotaxis response regulator CheB
LPILVVQHIATGFVEGLASWLGASCDLRVKVAESGEPLRARTVFLAPDERHLGVSRDATVILADAPPVNGFRPSGSYLFESAAQAFGASVGAVILTGMGSDGVEGLRAVKAAGGLVLAQDEASSVVYGMPRVAAEAGLADAVVPLAEVGARLTTLVVGGEDAHAHPGR